MIRHAATQPPATIGPLPVAMIQPSLGALLMAPVGRAVLPARHMATARSRAILLPAIATDADPEHRPAIRVAAKPLPENNFSMNRHPRLRAAFVNGNSSCQGKYNSRLPSLWHEGHRQRTPLLDTAGFFLKPPSPGNTLQLPALLTMSDR
ncbi:MAG: hypothetical protein ACLGSH_02345 [Acidobacteriota bacterium]